MKKTRHSLMSAVAIALAMFAFPIINAQQIAFPGAQGFGKYATGGRTGSVYHVTNLNDAGTGSFRDAVTTANRIVVFDVAGVIKISTVIAVAANVYIAGQTAPGEGITVYGNRITFSSANNTICRYVRFRMGVIGTSGKDAMGIANGSNMIFDHISASWGRDETFSINWDGKGTEPTNITIQNSIIAQGLLLHSAGGLIQTNGGVTLYRNLYADNSTRNNKVKGINQYVNNIVYNWNNAAYIMGGDSEGESFVNVAGNYFIMGPENGGTPISNGNSLFHIYAEDNWFDNTLDGTLNGYEIPFSEYSGGPDFQATPYAYPSLPTVAATSLYNDLLPSVGSSLPYRDFVDFYVINQVKSLGTEGALISTESSLPFGAPSTWTLWPGTTRVDSDNDGMPDDWEDANGLNKNSASDAMTIASNGYANIENYINGIDKTGSQAHLRTPLNFALKSATQNSITFKWLDYTDNEDGFIIERYINGAFVAIDSTLADENTYTLNGLLPEEKDTFRIRAYNKTLFSDYSSTLIAKSKPIEVPVIDPDTYVPDLVWSGLANTNWDKSSINWSNASSSVVFVDSSKVLFDDALKGDQALSVTENVPTKAMFVKSDYNYAFQGNGYISGPGSVNKTGTGTLSLLTDNTYKGATVVWDGTLLINKLANGGLSSSIGASSNYAFNFVLKGGKINYTGASVSTDRNITLDETSELSVASSSATVTLTGNLVGSGGFIKSGDGTLKVKNGVGNSYEGETTISGGTIDIDMNGLLTLNEVIGTSGVVNLTGGTLKTTNGQTANYETYSFDIKIPEGKVGGFIPFRNCSIENKILGSGTLNYTIPYVREYVKGDWSEFTGILNAIGANSTANGGSQLMLFNSVGLPNTRVNLSGNTKIINWETTGTMSLGGLSGSTGTYLGCASKNTKGTLMTWIVGGAGTDETFNGIINNDCSSGGTYVGVTSIVKDGLGIWRLTGANIYAGTTTVTSGTLIVNGIQTGTGKVTVQNEAKLAGTGKMPAIVEIQSGATLEPGDASIGTFTGSTISLQSGSFTNMEINKTTGANDKIVVNGAAALSGTLQLTITGTLAENDQFILFTATSFSGAFENISPAIPGEGLLWCFENGILKVVKTPSASITQSGATSFCQGDSVILTGAANALYKWSTGATTPSIVVKQSGKYALKITNAICASCVALSDTISIVLKPTPSIALGKDTTVCTGIQLLLDATTPNCTYLWNNGSSSATLWTSDAGTYKVKVTNTAGCSDSSSVLIGIASVPDASFTASGSSTLCDGEKVTFTATPEASYLWSTGETTQAITLSETKDVSLKATNPNYPACFALSNVVSVVVHPNPSVALGADTTICEGTELLLDATTANCTYLWNNGTSSPTLLVNEGGTYSAKITNAFGCSDSSTIVIAIDSLPKVSFSVAVDSLKATFVNTSSFSNNYYWDFGDNNSSDLEGLTYTYASSGTYTVILMAGNNCGIATDSTQVSVTSPVISSVLAGTKQPLVTIYPNPVATQITVEIEFPEPTAYSVYLVDMKGNTLKWLQKGVKNTKSTFTSSLPELKSGTYLLIVETAQGTRFERKIGKQ